MVGLADGAGIEDAGGVHHFVAGHVGVAVEKEIRSADAGRSGRDVDEQKGAAMALEEELFRQIECVVIVAQHAVEGAAEFLDGVEGIEVAKIPQVPDFVGGGDGLGDVGGEFSVGIGDDGDFHQRW